MRDLEHKCSGRSKASIEDLVIFAKFITPLPVNCYFAMKSTNRHCATSLFRLCIRMHMRACILNKEESKLASRSLYRDLSQTQKEGKMKEKSKTPDAMVRCEPSPSRTQYLSTLLLSIPMYQACLVDEKCFCRRGSLILQYLLFQTLHLSVCFPVKLQEDERANGVPISSS